MENLLTGFCLSQVVQDFLHQQYANRKGVSTPTRNHQANEKQPLAEEFEELFLPKCVPSPDSVELRHLASRRRTVVLIHSGAVLLICWVRRVEGKERILSLGGMLRDDTGRKTHVVLRSFEKLADPCLL